MQEDGDWIQWDMIGCDRITGGMGCIHYSTEQTDKYVVILY